MSAPARRTYVVTGAGSGIGAAVADRLHARGDALVLVARDEPRADDLRAAYDGSTALVADLADPGAVEAALAAADLPGAVDGLVQAAGVVDLAPIGRIDLASWQQTLAVNVTAPMLLTRALLPALRAAGGTVVMVNSSAGRRAHPDWASYAASKFALRAFADALRAEEGGHGVRVSTVYPGRTATPMQALVHAQEGKDYDPDDWVTAATVADSVLHCLDLPSGATVPELVVQPAPR